MDLLRRMNSVLDYIEDNLDDEIDDNTIAMLSASSKGMFQRIFTMITDMPLSEYIRKRRLTQAAFDIRNTNAKIIDIAVKYGYDSATAFSAAFKSFHGVTPSNARTSDIGLQSFQRFTFTLVLSVKGGNDNMQYRNINIENAEDILQKMVGKDNSRKYLRNVGERNNSKFACDGMRAAVILPDSVEDWNMDDVYFDVGSDDNEKFALYNVFDSNRKNSNYNFEITKKQAGDLINYLNELDDIDKQPPMPVKLNVNTMEFTNEWNNEQRMIAFNPKYIKEALDFIMCSGDEFISIYYISSTNALIMKSSRLYAAVLPVQIRGG